MPKARIGDMLLAEGLISQEKLEEALEHQQRTGSPLGQIITSFGYVKRFEFYNMLARQTGFEYIDNRLEPYIDMVDRELIVLFSPDELSTRLIFPVKADDNRLLLLASNPFDRESIDYVKERLNLPIDMKTEIKIATELDITKIVDIVFKENITQNSIMGLYYRRPEESAIQVITRGQILFLFTVASICLLGLYYNPTITITILMSSVNVFFQISVLFKLFLSLVGAKNESEVVVEEEELRSLDVKSLPVYSVLVPVYKEPEVVPHLIKALINLDYPQEKLDILLLLEEGDSETLLAAKHAAPPANFRFIVIPNSQPKTKPKACNYGLAFARGKYLTIYDAEDLPEPDQLKKAVVAFRNSPPDYVCYQAALNYFNRTENVLTRLFTLEYSYWFDYMLKGLNRLRLPIPLGGTSNHFDTEKLRALGGWDPFNVTEDADLGIRAYSNGYRIGILNSTTYEEANTSVRNWIRQRSRWQKGYAQTFLVHNRNPLKFLRTVGLKGFFTLQFFIGGSVFSAAMSPIFWGLYVFWFITRTTSLDEYSPPLFLYIGLFNLLAGNFCMIYLNMLSVFRRQYYDIQWFSFLNPLYWLLLSIATWKGLWQLIVNPFYWEKTVHGLTKSTHDGSKNGESAPQL
ncbi:glycosyltransferase [Cohnella sp. CFH 77786]|uniref:glycosyltransferase n=1 Tax=Cohnella sp. CFH 77786 TaxID=2662265 RepID=UPI001C61082B|nr:glycosyltransferase [Cohnella sp. CFH 77786]MBW5445380.1 glycosyltransferase [Cohnella sp. CFH 77786]